MKQVNVLMEEDLVSHLEKLAQVISLGYHKKVTVSDIVRKSVTDYTKFGEVWIDMKSFDGLTDADKAEPKEWRIDIKPTEWKKDKDGNYLLPNDELMRKLYEVQW